MTKCIIWCNFHISKETWLHGISWLHLIISHKQQ